MDSRLIHNQQHSLTKQRSPCRSKGWLIWSIPNHSLKRRSHSSCKYFGEQDHETCPTLFNSLYQQLGNCSPPNTSCSESANGTHPHLSSCKLIKGCSTTRFFANREMRPSPSPCDGWLWLDSWGLSPKRWLSPWHFSLNFIRPHQKQLALVQKKRVRECYILCVFERKRVIIFFMIFVVFLQLKISLAIIK